jgi:hypothetical protein
VWYTQSLDIIRPEQRSGLFAEADIDEDAGGIAGFRSVLNYAPEFDTVVVMLYNNDVADPELGLADVQNPALPLLRVEE